MIEIDFSGLITADQGVAGFNRCAHSARPGPDDPIRQKLTPRRAQDGPRGPKMAPEGPKGPKMAPSRPQRGPRWAPKGPRWPQVGSFGAQDGPKWAPKGPKMGPKGPQEGPQSSLKSLFQGLPTPKPKKGDPLSISNTDLGRFWGPLGAHMGPMLGPGGSS